MNDLNMLLNNIPVSWHKSSIHSSLAFCLLAYFHSSVKRITSKHSESIVLQLVGCILKFNVNFYRWTHDKNDPLWNTSMYWNEFLQLNDFIENRGYRSNVSLLKSPVKGPLANKYSLRSMPLYRNTCTIQISGKSNDNHIMSPFNVLIRSISNK